MKKFWENNQQVIKIFSIWTIFVFVAIYLFSQYLPFAPTFPYYETDIAPLYSRFVGLFAHFDGIHYLRLVKHGYVDTGIQAFFPVYPLLVRNTSSLLHTDPLLTGIVLNLSFLFGTLLIVNKYLLKKNFSRFALIFLLFPTSFFLVMFYSESLFIFLVAAFFASLKNKKYFLASLFAGIASGTRVVGFALGVALIVDYLLKNKKPKLLELVSFALVSQLGLMSYMYYLWGRWGDPLLFIHVQGMFGAGRSSGDIILLPQLIYRYLKIILTVPSSSVTFLRSLWELVIFFVSIGALYIARKKLEISEIIFCLLTLLVPTLSGTLSSYPRYLLVALPTFTALSLYTSKSWLRALLFVESVMLITALSFFVQGIFVS